MNGMILAAGFGTRLRPLTDYMPKALAPLAGRPLLAWALARLDAAGVGRIVVNSHYLPEQIAAFREESPIPFAISHEPDIRGTGGAFLAARELLAEEPVFCVTNVDIVGPIDLRRLEAAFIGSGALVGLVAELAVANGSIRFQPGTMQYAGVPAEGIDGPGLASANYVGVAFYRREVLDLLRPDDASVIPVWRRVLDQRREVTVLPLRRTYWRDIGTPLSLAQAHWDVLTGRLESPVPNRLTVDSLTPRCFPSHTPPAHRAGVGPYTWCEAPIPPDCRLERCVVLPGARLDAGATYRNQLRGAWGAIDLADA